MKYRVFLEKKARKQLKDLNSSSSENIEEKIIKLKEGFIPELDIKKLKGYKNHYRLRVGKYRILFELQKGRIIIVYAILTRKKAYR
ncbi:MAG: type II toxin-antitoxin system RelE/ParE family toxin [Euryarchaeota archaeon]|nr:type II toxin-antitoxin system RelE/ParE family toxin [Euryarchaeota archaeon]